MAPSAKIRIGGRVVRRFVPLGSPVRDGTVRCIACGQIDEDGFHDAAFCPATGGPRPMSRRERQRAEKIASLSARARALLERLQEGRFYKARDPLTPKAMAELEAAGLVCLMARPVEIWACYVPVGSKPYRAEVIAS